MTEGQIPTSALAASLSVKRDSWRASPRTLIFGVASNLHLGHSELTLPIYARPPPKIRRVMPHDLDQHPVGILHHEAVNPAPISQHHPPVPGGPHAELREVGLDAVQRLDARDGQGDVVNPGHLAVLALSQKPWLDLAEHEHGVYAVGEADILAGHPVGLGETEGIQHGEVEAQRGGEVGAVDADVAEHSLVLSQRPSPARSAAHGTVVRARR